MSYLKIAAGILFLGSLTTLSYAESGDDLKGTTLDPNGVSGENSPGSKTESKNDSNLDEKTTTPTPPPAEFILPEVTTQVDMSSSDLNRIVCPTAIKDVIKSREKQLKIWYTGHEAMVKFMVIKKKDGTLVYESTPTELNVSCGGKVYTLIIMPKRIPSQVIHLASAHSEKIKENLNKFDGIPFEKKIIQLIKEVYSEKVSESYTITEMNQKMNGIFQNAGVTLRRIVSVEGEGIRIKEFLVTPKDLSIQLQEKQFLSTRITDKPIAVSIDHLTVSKGETARVFIVEETVDSSKNQ